MRNPNPTIKPPFGSYIDPDHPLAKGLVGCWIFNEHEGRFVNDLSPYQNNGRILGGVSWKDGLRFNGSDTYVNCGNDESFQPKDDNWAVEFGINRKSAGAGDYPQIIGARPWNGVEDLGWTITIGGTSNEGKMSSHFGDGSNGWDVSVNKSNSISEIGTWSRWVVVFDKSNGVLRYYKDGTLDVSYTPTFPGTIEQTNNVYMGREIEGNNSRKVDALIDKISVYRRVPSLDEIEQLTAEPYCFIIWQGHRFIFDLGRLKCQSKH